jgi:hypothetical protein
MSKARTRKPQTSRPDQQAWWQSKTVTLILLLTFLTLFFVIGFNTHPTCTQNCQNQPAYFYNMQLPHSSYSQFYGTDDEGNSVHSSSSNDNNNSGHSSSSSENDDTSGFHGGSFHGGSEP